MVGVSLVLVLATVTPGGVRHVPAARVADGGPCTSAARSGDTFALACRQGVWLGQVGTLRLVLSCRAEEDHPNRVALLAPGRFVVSGPCGLFLIGAGGGVRRLAGIAGPRLLAADGRGHAVVSADDGVWTIGPDTERERVAGTAPGGTGNEVAPWRLELGGGLLLLHDVHGPRLLIPGGGVRAVPAGTGRRALLSDGSLCFVDATGQVEVRTFGGDAAARSMQGPEGGERPGERSADAVPAVRSALARVDGEEATGHAADGVPAVWFRLGLVGAERLEDLCGCGGWAYAASDRRWFWLSGAGVVARGGLPDSVQPPVPVCPVERAAAPWLLADGILYRPVRAAASGARCRVPGLEPMIEAAWTATGMPVVPDGAGWAALLPRLDLRAAGSLTSSGRWAAQEVHTWRRGARLAVSVRLVWSLDGLGRPPAASARESLRLELRSRRRALRSRLVRLLDAYRAGCGAGVPAMQGEIRTRLDLLTAGAFSAALSRGPPGRPEQQGAVQGPGSGRRRDDP